MSYIPHDVELAEALRDVLGRLQRSARRGVGEPSQNGLTSAQLELLSHLSNHPGSSVKEAAEALGLAPNTVSTLVGELIRIGLLERDQDAADRRVAKLNLTKPASKRITVWLKTRDTQTAEALALLTPAEREAIRGALPALRAFSEVWG